MNKDMSLIEALGSKLALVNDQSHSLASMPRFMSIHCKQLMDSSHQELQEHVGDRDYVVGLHTMYKVSWVRVCRFRA